MDPYEATMPLQDLLPADYNPRTITAEARKALRASVEKFGQAATLTWNRRTGRLVGGHQRAAVMRACGYREARVTVVDLDEAGEKELNLALNSDALAGEWDPSKLAPLLAELSRLDPGGFADLRLGEIDLALANDAVRAEVDAEKADIQAIEPSQEAADLAQRISAALAARITALAERDPKRLLAAFAVILPSRRGTDILVLADPNTQDAATELRRLHEAGAGSPVEALLESIAPMRRAGP